VWLTLSTFSDETGALKHILDPRIAPVNVMLLDQFFVKMPDIEVEVLVSVQTQYLLQFRRRRSLPTRFALSFIEQTPQAVFLVSELPSAHAALTDS